MSACRLAPIALLVMTVAGTTHGHAPLPFPRDTTKADLRAMQGEWRAVEHWMVLPDQRGRGRWVDMENTRATLVIEGRRLWLSGHGGAEEGAAFRLDGSKGPGWIDWEEADPEGKRPQPRVGIYRVSGGSLLLYYSSRGSRPDDPRGLRAGPGHERLLFKRVKPRP